MSPLKTLAIVLKSVNWKDTSKIATLFTREYGKMNVIAKGARRSNSRYRGVLESINLIEIIIYMSSNRQIQILGQADLEESFSPIRANFEKMTYTFAIFEITDVLFQQGAGDPVFFDFVKTIMYEMILMDKPSIIFWYFLIKLSSYLGFRPEFELCKHCSGANKTDEVYFSISEGTVYCSKCYTFIKDGWKLSASVRNFLVILQKANHKRLSKRRFDVDFNFPYTDFLMLYLRHHSEEKLELSSLKLLK